MPRHLVRKYLPTPEKIRNNRSLKFLGHALSDPNLWHINRHSLAGAAFNGVFCALLPMPFQMVLAAFLAMGFRWNLPLSIVLVWTTNPLTIIPVFTATWWVGATLLGLDNNAPDTITLEWLLGQVIPITFGSVLSGLVLGTLAYATVKLLWRYTVIRHWRQRQRRRAARDNQPPIV